MCVWEREGGFTGLVIAPTPALMDAAEALANAASHPMATYPTAQVVRSQNMTKTKHRNYIVY